MKLTNETRGNLKNGYGGERSSLSTGARLSLNLKWAMGFSINMKTDSILLS